MSAAEDSSAEGAREDNPSFYKKRIKELENKQKETEFKLKEFKEQLESIKAKMKKGCFSIACYLIFFSCVG